jgi:hypothetical protein
LLSSMMDSTTLPGHRSAMGRFLGGAALLLLLVGVVFVPLCTAVGQRAMPCCQHASSPLTSSASQHRCCTISPGSSDTVAISPAATQQSTPDVAGTTAALAFVPVHNPHVNAELATHVLASLDRPLHILNSVFLI